MGGALVLLTAGAAPLGALSVAATTEQEALLSTAAADPNGATAYATSRLREHQNNPKKLVKQFIAAMTEARRHATGDKILATKTATVTSAGSSVIFDGGEVRM